jgi:hypothetical protein
MHALAASCEELRARTGNPPLDCGVLQIICLKNLMIIDVLHRTRQNRKKPYMILRQKYVIKPLITNVQR